MRLVTLGLVVLLVLVHLELWFGRGGILSTAGGLVVFGNNEGALVILDAKTGKPLWHFHAGQSWQASPMTYMVGGVQYIALPGPAGIFAFALGM